MDNQLVTVAAVAVTGLITQITTVFRERRNRKWQVEDRNNTTAAVASVLTDHNAEIKTCTLSTTAQVLGAVEQGRAASEAAFSEANNLNQKILALNERLDHLQQALPCMASMTVSSGAD